MSASISLVILQVPYLKQGLIILKALGGMHLCTENTFLVFLSLNVLVRKVEKVSSLQKKLVMLFSEAQEHWVQGYNFFHAQFG